MTFRGAAMSGRRVHLVFNTHSDIGFTDRAGKVRRLDLD